MKLWRWLKAVSLWLIIFCVLLVWNNGFNPLDWDTWYHYRVRHNDKLTVSVVMLVGATYLAGMMGMGKVGGSK